MTVESAFIFAISLILLWIKPGPGQAAIVTRSLNDGFWAGFCMACGITLGGLALFLISAVGAAFIASYVAIIGFVFKVIGASYLIYCGYKGLSNIRSGRWKSRDEILTRKDIASNMLTGFLITMANPFAIFYFIGILPILVPLVELNRMDIAIASAILVYVGLMVDGLIAALAAQVRQTLSNTKFIEKINMITSIGFLLIAGFLLFSAITNYDGAFNIH